MAGLFSLLLTERHAQPVAGQPGTTLLSRRRFRFRHPLDALALAL